jgi:hypothetical protein
MSFSTTEIRRGKGQGTKRPFIIYFYASEYCISVSSAPSKGLWERDTTQFLFFLFCFVTHTPPNTRETNRCVCLCASRTMDLDGFDFGNGFPGSYQQQRHYAAGSTNAPTAEGYDPRGGSTVAAPQHQQLGGGGDGLSFHLQLNNAASSNGTTHQQANNMALLGGTNIATSPLNASLHHHPPLMPPHGTNAYNHTAGVGAVGGNTTTAGAASAHQYQHQQQHRHGQANHLSNSNKNHSSHSSRHLQKHTQQQQQQQHLHMQQQRFQQQAAALGLPPPVGAPAPHQQQLSRRRRSSQHRHQHQQQLMMQQHQQQHMKMLAGAAAYSGTVTSSVSGRNSNESRQSSQPKRRKPEPVKSEPWMEAIQLTITNLSTKPMSGTVVIRRLQQRTDEVLSRYLPCVDFLVQCQQDLRRGLQEATSKRIYHNMLRDKMTPIQFYAEYIERLPERFHRKNRNVMSPETLKEATAEIQKLCTSAKSVQRQGCETVKNTFLGGMKDGESWGLRKWLSKHGGALMICNDSECILHAVQKLQRSDDATIKLARQMRPLAKASLTRLMKDVPESYQEQSSAHPFLPFFHRLEAALRGLSNFDPEDDDVICIDDDDEVEVLKAAPPSAGPKKCHSSLDNTQNGASGAVAAGKRKAVDITIDDDDDNIGKADGNRGKSANGGSTHGASKKQTNEALNSKPSAKKRAKTASAGTPGGFDDADPYNIDTAVNGLMATVADVDADSDYMKALLRSLNDETDDDDDVMNINFDEIDRRTSIMEGGNNVEGIFDLPASLDRMAFYFESDQQDLVRPTNLSHAVGSDSFWTQSAPYAEVLRIFSNLLSDQDAIDYLLDPVDLPSLENDPAKDSYMSIVKHPLCFRDIVVALVAHFDAAEMTVVGNSGNLETPTLSSWNMWRGDDLLMAIDLVFLNALAYDKATEGTKTNMRSRINRLRKSLWTGIRDIIEQFSPGSDAETKKKLHPTRRSESSGFVVHKLAKSKEE